MCFGMIRAHRCYCSKQLTLSYLSPVIAPHLKSPAFFLLSGYDCQIASAISSLSPHRQSRGNQQLVCSFALDICALPECKIISIQAIFHDQRAFLGQIHKATAEGFAQNEVSIHHQMMILWLLHICESRCRYITHKLRWMGYNSSHGRISFFRMAKHLWPFSLT